MVPYFWWHDCNQHMQIKPVKFGYKLWVAATPLGYAIQFYPYAGKDANYDKDLGLGGSVVMSLVSKFPSIPKSSYHVVMDNFFTSPSLLRLLKSKGIAATGTVRSNRTENSPLISVEEMKKKPGGTCDVVNDRKSNGMVTLVWWKDNNIVTVASTVFGKEPISKVSRFIKERGGRVEINQPNAIVVYNKKMGGVDWMDQNISVYIINIRNKWWCPLFQFSIDLAFNNANQLYGLQLLQPGQRVLDLLGFWREIAQAYCSKDFTQSVSKVFLSNIYMLIFHLLAYYMYLFCIDYMFFFISTTLISMSSLESVKKISIC